MVTGILPVSNRKNNAVSSNLRSTLMPSFSSLLENNLLISPTNITEYQWFLREVLVNAFSGATGLWLSWRPIDRPLPRQLFSNLHIVTSFAASNIPLPKSANLTCGEKSCYILWCSSWRSTNGGFRSRVLALDVPQKVTPFLVRNNNFHISLILRMAISITAY